MTTEASSDVQYHGGAWLSFEIPNYLVSITTSGALARKLHQLQVATTVYACNPDFPDRAQTEYSLTSLDTVGLTNYTSGVSTNAYSTLYGGYSFGFFLYPSIQVYNLESLGTQLGGGSGYMQATEKATIRGQTVLCNGGTTDSYEGGTNIVIESTWPYIDPSSTVLPPFPMSDSNVISGSMNAVATDAVYGVINTHFDWNFHRNTNASPLRPLNPQPSGSTRVENQASLRAISPSGSREAKTLRSSPIMDKRPGQSYV